eukprot:4864264-Pleurochrysis_carterae.AAC.3
MPFAGHALLQTERCTTGNRFCAHPFLVKVKALSNATHRRRLSADLSVESALNRSDGSGGRAFPLLAPTVGESSMALRCVSERLSPSSLLMSARVMKPSWSVSSSANAAAIDGVFKFFFLVIAADTNSE